MIDSGAVNYFLGSKAYKQLARTRVLDKTRFRGATGKLLRIALGVPRRLTPSSLVVSEKHRFVYVGVPKAASSRVRRFVIDLIPEEFEVRKEFFAQFLNDRPHSETFFTFRVIRNPWARALSFYRDKLANPRRPYGAEAIWGLRRGMSFPQFAR